MNRAHRCITFAGIPTPKVRKPRKKRSEMTEEKIIEADAKRIANKVRAEAKKEWETALTAWSGDKDLRWAVDTVAMYKSDAKSAFGLTEKEILTLPHESIMASSKTFFLYKDVKDLAVRKFVAGASKPDARDPRDQGIRVRTFTKWGYNLKIRTHKNWLDSGVREQHWVEARLKPRQTTQTN